MHSVLLAIPSLGKGFEHLLGKTPSLGRMIKLFNEEGFMRAVLFEMPHVLPQSEGSWSSMQEGSHSSQLTITSETSSNASLTSSQKDVFGMEEKTHWPLAERKEIDDW